MKKLHEIPDAWGNADPGEPPDDWGKDALIERLKRESHKAVSVGRAVLTIEQCGAGDEFPSGWSEDPLKISVFADPDAGFGGCDSLYLHADRAGLMDLFLVREGKVSRMVPLPPEVADAAMDSDFAQVSAVLKLAADYLTGYYQQHCHGQVIDRRPDGTEVVAKESVKVEYDEELERLGREVVDAIDAYKKRLLNLPNVFVRWDEAD
jgi:hypothetical protein